MFYRQAAMFVAYLAGEGGLRLETFMRLLDEGASFAKAFESAYGMRIETAWENFAAELQA